MTGAFPDAGSAGENRWLIQPAQVFDGDQIRSGVAIEVDRDRIAGLHPVATAPRHLPVWRTELLACPGFFDVQVNGGGGILFNANPTAEGMRAIAAAHRRSGTAACLVTVITDTDEVLDRAAVAAVAACGQDGVAGLHIEGPHLSPRVRGTHRKDLIRPWSEKSYVRAYYLRAAGVPLLMTLAPEEVPEGVIQRLTALGVVVSLGHSAATPDVVRRAIAEGARAATHLFNGMEPPTSRHPGMVGTVILSDLYAGFIADGHHVHPDMLTIAARARPEPGRMVLVSDAMPTVNGPASFLLQGERIELRGGRLINAEGSLAGVHATMASSLAYVQAKAVMALKDALDSATAAPARMMRLSDRHGMLAANRPADLVFLAPETLEVRHVLLGGCIRSPA